MTIFSSFSRPTRDRDGSWMVYCVTCKEPICRTTIQLGKVQCELCRRVENGEILTEDAIKTYRLSKQGVMGMTMMNLTPPEQNKEADNLRGQGSGFLKAIGRLMGRDLSEAEVVVQEKHRGRLFDQVDLENLGDDTTSLGSMESIEEQLGREESQ